MCQLSRRTFLAAATLGLVRNCDARVEEAVIVDSHVHCFAGVEDKTYPYHINAPYRPDKALTPEFLLKSMDAAGIQHAIVVHPEPYQDDHRYLEYCLKIGAKRLKGTCLFFADQPNAIDRMKKLCRSAPIVAARVHAYAMKRLPPFGKKSFADYWRAAGEQGLALQLHLDPPYAAGFEPYIKQYSDFRVIIDHYGWPTHGNPNQYETIVHWSRFPHVVLKLSSIPHEKDEPKIKELVRRVANQFGPERMLYGGGFQEGVTAASYRAERERLVALLPDWTAKDVARVMGGNAVKWFGFDG